MSQGLNLKRSLKFKIITSMFAVMAIVGGLSLILMRQSSNYQMKKSQDMMMGNVMKVGQSIAVQFYERYGDVQAFALNPALQTTDRALISSYLDQYVGLYGIYDLILLVDAQGRFVASNTVAADGRSLNTSALSEKNYTEAPWFRAVIDGRYTEDQSRGYANTFLKMPMSILSLDRCMGKKMWERASQPPLKIKRVESSAS